MRFTPLRTLRRIIDRTPLPDGARPRGETVEQVAVRAVVIGKQGGYDLPAR
jgi:hypothetical protein